MTVDRERIAAEALAWVGTPYVHQASIKGVGCDCLGLVRGVWRSIEGDEPWVVPRYSPRWDETTPAEPLLCGLRQHFASRGQEIELGRVLAFRMTPGARVKHLGLVTGRRRHQWKVTHAYWGRAAVESWLSPWWHKRLVASFEFPSLAAQSQ